MEERDYTSLTRRFEAVGSVQLVAQSGPYPVQALELGTGTKAQVLLTAGLHGDEPAGPEAALRFVESLDAKWLERCLFLILFCLNPHGYVHNIRESEAGLDLNREFGSDEVEVVALVKEFLRGRHFDFSMDFHEDWEASGFYFYEAKRDQRWLGPTIVEEVRKLMPIDGKVGENDEVIAEGVFLIDPEWGIAGLASYVYEYHTDHAMMGETPTDWPLDERVAAHLKALDTALSHRVSL